MTHDTPPPSWYEPEDYEHHKRCKALQDRLNHCSCVQAEYEDEQMAAEAKYDAGRGK